MRINLLKLFISLYLILFFIPNFCYSAEVLRVAFPDPPATLDWNGQVTTIEAPIVMNLAEGLFTYNAKTRSLEPAMAESVIKNSNNTEYTFTISPLAKWSDGRAVYAQDFVDSWLKLISPQNTSLYNYYLFDILNAEAFRKGKITQVDAVGIKAIDDKTLKVTLRNPVKNWEATTVFWPLFPIRKDKIEKFGANWSKPGVMVSNGPYVLDSYEVGNKMILKKNKFYHKLVENEEVHIYFSLDQKKTLELFQNNFFPFIHSSPETEVQKIKTRYLAPTLQHFSMTVNAKKYPMNDRLFREAIFKAINMKEVLKNVQGQNLTIANNLIPPSLRTNTVQINPEFNTTKAKTALKHSGYINSKNSSFSILTRLVEPFPQIGKAIKEQIEKNLGLKVELSTLRTNDFNTYVSLNEYDLAIINWVVKIPEPQDFLKPYSPKTPNSRLIFDNDLYPELLKKGALAKDKKESLDIFDQAQKLYIQDESVLFPLFFGQEVFYLGPSVSSMDFDYMAFPIFKSVKLNSPNLLPEKNQKQ